MRRTGKCSMCPAQGARDIVVDVELGGVHRIWQLHLCKWDWRSLEAMFDAADRVMHQEHMFSDGRRVTWMW